MDKQDVASAPATGLTRGGRGRQAPRLAALLVLLAASVLSGCQNIPSSSQGLDLVIRDVTVIDPESRRVLPHRSVFVHNGRIFAMTGTAAGRRFTARQTIDGSDRFLIPGLMDMHVHLFLPDPPKPSLNLLLANGVTGIREMSSDCWAAASVRKGCVGEYRSLQTRIRAGEVPGPELLALTSTMVMGPSRQALPAGAPSFITPRSEAEAQQLVRHLATRGVDLIKTHDSIPSAVFPALMRQAGSLGMKVGGHVPFAAGSAGAAQLGYASIEHARDLLYDCSAYGAEFRRREAAVADGVPGAVRPTSVERLRRTVAEHDPELCRRLLAELRATGVFYVPTHVTREMEARAADSAYRNDPSRRYVPAERNGRWEADLDETASLPTEQRAALREFFLHGLTITGLAHRAGLSIMAGTDANDTMMVPGFSLHTELRLMREAGLSTMEVLRSATTTPARFLGRSADLGGIAVGKEADMVLLERNPLADIRNTESIEVVVANGVIFSRSELDALLRDVERTVADPRP